MTTLPKCIATLLAVGMASGLTTAVLAADPIPATPAPTMALSPAAVPDPVPAATPTAPAATEAAPASWPPGLLMDGLGSLGLKKPMEDTGFRIWGFDEIGFMGRLTGGQNPLIMRGFDARRPNNIRFHQLRLTFERPYDNTKDIDVGFRVDTLYGGDAMLTHSPGLLDKAGSGTADNWFDLTQMYAQAWIKTGKESGLEITAGKFVTPFGAEVIDATGNSLYSRGILFNYAIPFTHTGVKLNYIFSPQWSAYVAAVQGWEVFENNNDAWSVMAGGAYTSPDAKAVVALNFITGPEQNDNVSNQRTVVDLVLTYHWNDALTQVVNFDYGVEEAAAASGSAAHWYGAANYFTYTINDYLAATWRIEWFRDDGGARTGMTANYFENTWGVTITPAPKDPVWKNVSFRPELRWDAADKPVFGGDRKNQLTLGFDVIFKF
jgi:hypothetical protein